MYIWYGQTSIHIKNLVSWNSVQRFICVDVLTNWAVLQLINGQHSKINRVKIPRKLRNRNFLVHLCIISTKFLELLCCSLRDVALTAKKKNKDEKRKKRRLKDWLTDRRVNNSTPPPPKLSLLGLMKILDENISSWLWSCNDLPLQFWYPHSLSFFPPTIFTIHYIQTVMINTYNHSLQCFCNHYNFFPVYFFRKWILIHSDRDKTETTWIDTFL